MVDPDYSQPVTQHARVEEFLATPAQSYEDISGQEVVDEPVRPMAEGDEPGDSLETLVSPTAEVDVPVSSDETNETDRATAVVESSGDMEPVPVEEEETIEIAEEEVPEPRRRRRRG